MPHVTLARRIDPLIRLLALSFLIAGTLPGDTFDLTTSVSAKGSPGSPLKVAAPL
jgi:hypothetical protein